MTFARSLCDEIKTALSQFELCEMREEEARVVTHCLYPSFDPVPVFVRPWGEGYILHDGGEASATAWLHARDDKLTTRYLRQAAERYGLSYENKRIQARIASKDWLYSGIVSVSNAAAWGAHACVDHVYRSEVEALKDRISDNLARRFSKNHVRQEVTRRGESGRTYRFDFELRENDFSFLIEAVTPHPASISSKYVAFSDTRGTFYGSGLAIFDRDINSEDKTLLSQVADVVPAAKMLERIEYELQR
jgi:hypothetical protein